MKRILTVLAVFGVALSADSVRAGNRTIDLSAGCKLYKLSGKKWVPADAQAMDGFAVEANAIVRDEEFTVFKAPAGTYGVNRKCLRETEAAEPRRTAAPAPERGDMKTPWSAVFSLGYNLGPGGTRKTTYNGATASEEVSFKNALNFLGEGNYRFNDYFRGAVELGISQLSTTADSGNETSFFDVRPEYVFRIKKTELYVGPMIGLFFLSQTKETVELTGANLGTTIDVKQQTASAFLLGLALGADYALNSQFDLGVYLRYFKPGSLKVTGTETFPTAGNPFVAELSTNYVSAGLRFAIHF